MICFVQWLKRLPPATLHGAAALALAAVSLLLPACDGDGHFCILGYSTVPNYDMNIKTVYVPIFENRTFRRGVEFELTQEVVRAIEKYTPYKVISDCDRADTELRGKIISFNKGLLNRNQLNEVREAETVLMVEVVWRDRRTGEILSAPVNRAAGAVPPAPFIEMPSTVPQEVPIPGNTASQPQANQPQPPAVVVPCGPPAPVPTLVSSYATFIPEVGGSITTAEAKNIQRLAVHIVSMMEQPW